MPAWEYTQGSPCHTHVFFLISPGQLFPLAHLKSAVISRAFWIIQNAVSVHLRTVQLESE